MTILFEQGNEKELNSFLEKYSQCILLADAKTNGFCVPHVRNKIATLKNASLIIIPDGEHNKNVETCKLVFDQLLYLRADKNSILIHVGGGMVSDLGGFCASVYQRGIAFMNIPTTLLSMVDASVGGKTAIDFSGIKNMIGTFQHPEAVYLNPIFLNSLSEKNLASGIAEMVKHALLQNVASWKSMLDFEKEEFYTIEQIQKSVKFKLELVSQDEFDKDKRQALNFGHTIGHAIESLSLKKNQALLHGEAIMYGMMEELKLSVKLFGLNPSILTDYNSLMKRHFDYLDFKYSFEELKPFLLADKKNKDGIRMSLLKNIGDCQTQRLVSELEIESIITNHEN